MLLFLVIRIGTSNCVMFLFIVIRIGTSNCPIIYIIWLYDIIKFSNHFYNIGEFDLGTKIMSYELVLLYILLTISF